MNRRFLLPVLAAALMGSASLAQDDETAKPAKPEKEVADKLAELKKIVLDKKFERDAEGPGIIDALLVKQRAGMHEKDVEAFARGLEDVLMDGKLRDPGNLALYRAAATALGELGPAGATILRKVYDNKRFPTKPEWVPLRENLLKSMGKTKDEKSVEFLLKEARRSPEKALMAAAGEALGNFEGSSQKVRDEIVRGLLARYGELDSRSRQIDPGDIEAQNAREYLAVISDKWNTTLSKLTRQGFRSYPEWQKWYNENKSAEWK